jgi:hypothetical protein
MVVQPVPGDPEGRTWADLAAERMIQCTRSAKWPNEQKQSRQPVELVDENIPFGNPKTGGLSRRADTRDLHRWLS